MEELDPQQNPLDLFSSWMKEAEASEPNDPTAAALATSHLNVASVRMVLVKGIAERGLHFFTNLESQKGRELSANPFASLCFHWKTLRKQVRFSGKVQRLSTVEVEQYFHSRSRKSQFAAAVSKQSCPLDSRIVLEREVAEYTQALGDNPVPLPDTWVGYTLEPLEVEFWSDGPDRLHDRLLFRRNETWSAELLYP